MDDGVKSRGCERMDVGWWLDRDADLHVAEHKIPALVTDYIKPFLGMRQKLGGHADFWDHFLCVCLLLKQKLPLIPVMVVFFFSVL